MFFNIITISPMKPFLTQTGRGELSHQKIMLLFSVVTIQEDTGHINMVMARVCMRGEEADSTFTHVPPIKK